MRLFGRPVTWATLCLIMNFWFSKAAAQDTNAAEKQLASANSDFGFRLLSELTRSQAGENVFISPYSISSVLEMVGTGARGATQQELWETLGLANWSSAKIDSAYRDLNASLQSVPTNILLNIANALWYRTGAQLDPQFASINQEFYQATLQSLDFSDTGSERIMNQWGAQNTHGKIQKIVQGPLPADTAMVLANAIYFKGTWLHPFDAKNTKPRAFHAPNGDHECPMMRQTRTFSYQQGDGFQAVELPYGGDRLQMVVLLPEQSMKLGALVGRMNGRFWQDTIMAGLKSSRGTLVFPRFHLQYGADLKQPLSDMGIRLALSPSADFSGMSSSQLFLSKVEHRSFVEVNEQGTEAAAVTTGVMALASVRNEPPPFQMIVDRPFAFFIVDHVTGSILFMGAVSNPASGG